MADVELSIGGRHYNIACRDGGEAHLRTIAAHVDRKAEEARAAVGNVNEVRQLLFAALLLADELADKTTTSTAHTTPDIAPALAKLAARIESVADALEGKALAS